MAAGDRQGVWYHATTAQRAAKIMKEGLDPGKAKGDARVWFAADPYIAVQHAKATGKRRPVVLVVRFPRSKLVYHPANKTQPAIYYTRWRIPPTLIHFAGYADAGLLPVSSGSSSVLRGNSSQTLASSSRRRR